MKFPFSWLAKSALVGFLAVFCLLPSSPARAHGTASLDNVAAKSLLNHPVEENHPSPSAIFPYSIDETFKLDVVCVKITAICFFDADGNLTQDGLWTYSWDAENRLLSMQSLASVPDAAKQRLDFVYDYQGRRIQKVVSVWNGSVYLPTATLNCVYDGWNKIAEVAPSGLGVQSYLWGQDLSGSYQGAGGVGGLLMVNDVAGRSSHFVAMDGNGNVAALVNAKNGDLSAQYEYGPFGENVRATGPMARANPFRFSTKYQDNETGLLYYGYRYYNAGTGRWLSRDPIGEVGSQLLRGDRIVFSLTPHPETGTRNYHAFSWDLSKMSRLHLEAERACFASRYCLECREAYG